MKQREKVGAGLIINRREKRVLDKHVSEGWIGLHKGWPDFLFYRRIDGKLELKLVEVKKTQSRRTTKMGLSKHQRVVCDLLKEYGLNVVIEYIP